MSNVSANDQATPSTSDDDPSSGLLTLAALSLVTGAASGLLGTAFRLTLTKADEFRDWFVAWAQQFAGMGMLLVVASCATATALAALLVRKFSPEASGSGIPHVEGVLRGMLPPMAYRLIPVKFFGGVLAMGAGLALGREGPCVQLGAGISEIIGRVLRRSMADQQVLLAAGAGAGLATAFNAPIAGAVFVLEELVRRFDTRITIAVFGASAGAIAVSRPVLGESAEFAVDALPYPQFGMLPIYLALGAIIGLLGVAYNSTILAALDGVEKLRRVPVELRGALIGAVVGVIAWFAPHIVGGGESLTQSTLRNDIPLGSLALIFLLRFGLGPMCYAAQTPGGLFAPMLVLGAQAGLFLGLVTHNWMPSTVPHPIAFAVVGTAAFFAATVRAPLTGIILVTELTGCFTLLLPLLAACFAAMAVSTILKSPPIYDSLLERRLRATSR